MPRLVPPAATRFPLGITLRLTAAGLFDAEDSLLEQATMQTGVDDVFLLSSGRAAQTVALEAMAATAPEDRRQVIIPAYTCYSVAASIVRAGLDVYPVDIDPITLDYDYSILEQVDFDRVLAINASNLFGVASDTQRLRRLGKDNDVFVIDDAAQALGSMAAGYPVGTVGDVGIFSLDRGKNLPTYAGGILLVMNESLRDTIARRYEGMTVPGTSSRLKTSLKFVLSSILSHPSLFWLPARLPFLGIGETHFDPNFSITRLDRAARTIGALLWPQLGMLNHDRRSHAERMARAIRPLNYYEIPGWDEQNPPTYLRLPVLAHDAAERDRLIERVMSAGIVASRMYPDAIPNVPQLSEKLVHTNDSYSGAQRLVDCLITLPTHGHVADSDEERIVRILTEEAQS